MKILLAVDGSSYTQRMLSYLATHHELLGRAHEYTAIHVVPPVPGHARSFVDKNVIDSYYHDTAREVLNPVVSFARQQGWTLTTLQPVGHVADSITEAATAGKFDLLVLGSHGHAAITNMLLGSVVARVMAQTKTPVLIIR